MKDLPRGSKQWWSMYNRLLDKQSGPTLFPPIKSQAGTWCEEPIDKANAFARCWEGKNNLPPEVYEMPFFFVEPGFHPWFPIRSRNVECFLSKLRIDQATGPDGIYALFLIL